MLNKSHQLSIIKVLFLSFGAASAPICAQEAEPDPEIYTLEPVNMTGSLFTPYDADPNETLDAFDREDLLLSGSQRPIQFLRLQPSFFGAMNTSNDSNGGTGSSSPNIRGLGVLRTLNLINGRRAGGSSAITLEPGGFANMNLIPEAGVESIDVLLETASTTYGSDAIGGVVNTNLYDRFNGVRLSGLYGDTTQGGGQTEQYSLLAGFPLDEDTHLTLLGSYYEHDVIWARDRELSATTNFLSRGGTNRGSSTFPGRANFFNGVTSQMGILAPGISYPTAPGDYVNYNQNSDAFNYNAYAPNIPAMEIVSGMAAITHSVSDQLTLYGDFLYSYQNQDNGLAPAPWGAYGPAVAGNPFFQAVENSPHNPFAPGDLGSVSYRSFELGNLETRFSRNAFRVVGGARGLIEDRWEWDSAFLYTQTETTYDLSGVADSRLLTPFIANGYFNPFARSVSGVNGGVPFNNYASLQAAAIEPQDNFFENMLLYDAKVSGRLVDIPAGPLMGALGFEFRYESIDATPDAVWATGTNLGGGGYTNDYSGIRRVFAMYGESHVPLLAPEQDVFLVENLDLALGLRYEHFGDSGNDPVTGVATSNQYDNVSWKAALRLKPVDSVTLRATYSTGFRAPTLYESYAGEIYDYPILVDPTGQTPPGTAVPTLLRGNPSLDPEISQNFSASFIWEPEPVEGLSLRVDYYYVTIDNAIANGAQFILNTNDPNFVTRNAQGQVVFVLSRFFNASSLTTQGVDYRLDYDVTLTNDIRAQASLGVNQVISYNADVEGYGDISFAGGFIDKRSNNLSPGAIPRWKGLASLYFFIHDATLGANVEYIGSYQDDSSFTFANLPRTVEGYVKVNFVSSYEFKETGEDWLDNTTLTFGVDNVFDQSPPFAAGAFADGYDTSLYTIQNRFVYGSITKEF